MSEKKSKRAYQLQGRDMLILGLNAYHGDASACLVSDGVIVAAAEEERFRRVKHCAGFPLESIRYCLREWGVDLGEVDHIAINSDPKANVLRRLGYALTHSVSPKLILDRLHHQKKRVSIMAELESIANINRLNANVHRVEHHLAHLASCFLVSPFEEAVAVSVDGFGDFASAAWGLGQGDKLSVDKRVYFPHSLGIFYQALTQHLGFLNYGDEYKVMGLAPYGQPYYLAQMRNLLKLNFDGSFTLNLDYFRHHKKAVSFEWRGGAPEVGLLYGAGLCDLLGPARSPGEPLEARHRDIAHSVQAMYEEAFFNLLNALHDKHKVDSLTLAGGCAMNSVANGKVMRMTPFKKVYIQAAAGDAGGAIGAAVHTWHKIKRRERVDAPSEMSASESVPRGAQPMNHAYLGPSYDNENIAELLEKCSSKLKAECCYVERSRGLDALCDDTAKAISNGLVVGWFQGRMEWGPRALGNRSIVADPRRLDMKDILNNKIKRRESFRPFAPSILREQVAEWFEEEADVPFMMKVFQVRESKRQLIPAVTHVDGSGRLQTVHRETNYRYYRLIESFQRITGIPIVLNTSFNENEPIVCRPQEALECFLRTKMDWIILEDWIVKRQEA